MLSYIWAFDVFFNTFEVYLYYSRLWSLFNNILLPSYSKAVNVDIFFKFLFNSKFFILLIFTKVIYTFHFHTFIYFLPRYTFAVTFICTNKAFYPTLDKAMNCWAIQKTPILAELLWKKWMKFDGWVKTKLWMKTSLLI